MTRIFLCGDVMTGRGIDQILQHPGDPTLHETWVSSAEEYVRIAERRNGEIPRRVEPSYIWGDALELLDQVGAEARIINLETAVTDTGEPWPAKGIHYRMNPANVGCLTAADIDCCVLANNHVLDWSYSGLEQTLETLDSAGLNVAGAGLDDAAAQSPALVETATDTLVVVLAMGTTSSGITPSWRAESHTPGVALAEPLDGSMVNRVSETVTRTRGPDDVAVVSIHWGPNWGYHIPRGHRSFARQLIDQAGVDVVHGHSSHHPLGIEVYRDRPIVYGCGDLINDYEGIGGHEEYRPDLGLVYLVDVDPQAGLQGLEMVPMRMERFRLTDASPEESGWMAQTLSRECRSLGTTVEMEGEGRLALRW